MMTVSFDTDNAAFAAGGETGRILRDLAVKVDAGMSGGSIIDINGTKVGSWSLGWERTDD